MPKQSTTPLGYLMDMLYVQGTQLAKMVHVDRTVISRWKNGRADLNMKSVYFDDMVNALLDVNEQQGLGTLERFFTSLTRKNITKRRDLHKLVSAWLVSREMESPYFDRQFQEVEGSGSLYNANYSIFRGVPGKWDAVDYLLGQFAQGQEQDKPAVMWGYDTGFGLQRTRGNEAVAAKKKLMAALKEGRELQLMFFLNRPPEQVFRLFSYWLPIFLQPGVQAHYTYDIHTPFYDYIYSLKGKLALVGSGADSNKGGLYTALYDDPMTVNQIDAYVDTLMGSMQPLYTRLDNRNMCLDYRDAPFTWPAVPSRGQYIVQEDFPLISFHKQTIEDIVADLELGVADERKLLTFCRNCATETRRVFSGDGFARVVLSHERLLEIQEAEEVEVASFSTLLGRRVMVPSRHLLREVREFAKFALDTPGIELALRPAGVSPLLQQISLWVQEGASAYFVPVDSVEARLMTREFTSVHALFAKADSYWQQLPYDCKQPDWVAGQIERLK